MILQYYIEFFSRPLLMYYVLKLFSQLSTCKSSFSREQDYIMRCMPWPLHCNHLLSRTSFFCLVGFFIMPLLHNTVVANQCITDKMGKSSWMGLVYRGLTTAWRSRQVRYIAMYATELHPFSPGIVHPSKSCTLIQIKQGILCTSFLLISVNEYDCMTYYVWLNPHNLWLYIMC